MRRMWEGAFVVAALASSECYAANRPVLTGRPESYAISQWRHHHHDGVTHAGNVIRPVLPSIRFTIR